MNKDYIKKIDDKAERRFLTPQFELMGDEDGKTIEGVAAVINSTTDMGWYDERVEKGAFDDVLEDDVVALFNHDPNIPLARTTGVDDGKLELFLNNNGDLAYRFRAPQTSIGQDLLTNIRNRVVTKSSFAFTIEEEEWVYANGENGLKRDVRSIKKIGRLYDVSPVTYPAYPDTDVAARSLERDGEKQKKAELRKYKRVIFDIKYKNK